MKIYKVSAYVAEKKNEWSSNFHHKHCRINNAKVNFSFCQTILNKLRHKIKLE